MGNHYVVSGFGASDSPAARWNCELVKVFASEVDAIRFAEKHYEYLLDEIMTTCNAHWFKSIFVEVVGASKVGRFGLKGVE